MKNIHMLWHQWFHCQKFVPQNIKHHIIATLIIVPKNWKQNTYPPINRWSKICGTLILRNTHLFVYDYIGWERYKSVQQVGYWAGEKFEGKRGRKREGKKKIMNIHDKTVYRIWSNLCNISCVYEYK